MATSDLSNGVPKAFQLPAEKSKLLEYAEKNPDVLWVQKDNTHRYCMWTVYKKRIKFRNIKIKSTNDMDLSKNNSFVQKFVDNPLLIDNKFELLNLGDIMKIRF